MQNPWIADANFIRDQQMLKGIILHETPQVVEFLGRRSSKYFITATKGFGKTHLLLAKRNKLQDKTNIHSKIFDTKGIIILPEDQLRDRPFGSVSLSKELLSDLSILETFDVVWSLAIILSTLKVSSLDLDEADRSVVKILNSQSRSPFSFFQRLLSLLKDDRPGFFHLQELLNTDIMDYFRQIHQPISLFLDDMDEYFEAHIDRRKALGQTDPIIWFNAQTSLLRTAAQLMKMNQHVKIYIGVRKEAYVNISNETADSLQIASITVDINYDEDDLKNIFICHINKEAQAYLCDSSLLSTNPLGAFFGLDELTNNRVLGNPAEDPFNYVLRHTLWRPRDIVFMGSRIRSIEPSKRTPSKLKLCINGTAIEIANQYIREANPFQEHDIRKILCLLPSNVVTNSELHEICKVHFSINTCIEKCKDCNYSSPFYTLYKVGLLGYVRKHPTSGNPIQTFIKPGDKLLEVHGYLPESNIYLLHPIVNDILPDLNSSFTIDHFNVVGPALPWNYQYELERFIESANLHNNRCLYEKELEAIKSQKGNSYEDIVETKIENTIGLAAEAVKKGWTRRFLNHIISLEPVITKFGKSSHSLQKLVHNLWKIFDQGGG